MATWYVAVDGSDTGLGSIADPFQTLQRAVDEMVGGDLIFLRGGTYTGHTTLTSEKNGTILAWSSIASYPGEWAVLDGGNNLPDTHPGKCVIGNSGYFGDTLKYWKFERLEITGGRTADGTVAGGYWGTYGPAWFRFCYVHDNYATVNPGSDGTNGGLRGARWQNSLVEYCVFERNGGEPGVATGHNFGDINVTTDYVENPENVNIAYAHYGNEYRYNFFNGSQLGVKYKNSQWLSLDNTGNHIVHQALGDKIHHNIFLNNEQYSIDARQDFIQIYNNVMINCAHFCVGEQSSEDREPFHACVYNNHLIGTRFSIYHSGIGGGDNSSYTAPIVGKLYGYNNIFESGPANYDSHRDINFFFTYSGYDIDSGGIDMGNIVWENNLLMDRTSSDYHIVVGDNADIYSVDDFKSLGYSDVFYSDEATIYTTVNNYSIEGNYSLGGADTIANGGVDAQHPYLQGVTIPDYVGAVKPSDQGWFNGVRGLANIANMISGTDDDPAWIEGNQQLTGIEATYIKQINNKRGIDVILILEDTDTGLKRTKTMYFKDQQEIDSELTDRTNKAESSFSDYLTELTVKPKLTVLEEINNHFITNDTLTRVGYNNIVNGTVSIKSNSSLNSKRVIVNG